MEVQTISDQNPLVHTAPMASKLGSMVIGGIEYVVISKARFEALLEELEDLEDSLDIADIKLRNEPSYPMEDVFKELGLV